MARQPPNAMPKALDNKPANQVIAPLFASTWVAFFILLRDNLLENREDSKIEA